MRLVLSERLSFHMVVRDAHRGYHATGNPHIKSHRKHSFEGMVAVGPRACGVTIEQVGFAGILST